MDEKAKDILLTDLCAICHISPIKYTCPRCGIHTCSLPCVKRHKSWAQCSGVRDPAAYRKRAELATPASVDQDFNFITSVERSLQRADDLTSKKGIDLVPSGLNRRGNRFDDLIAERGIHLVKAPKGLSRNKQNKSSWAGQANGIAWTTEWVHHDGRKKNTIVFESSTVEEAFQKAFGRKPTQHQKRKRSVSETHPAPVAKRDVRSPQAVSPDDNKEKSTEETQQGSLNGVANPTGPVPSPNKPEAEMVSSCGQAQVRQQVHFFLCKPNTTSKVKCLIPVAPDSKVADVLRNRTLLEFPTIYVRQEASDSLPEPFITEEKYDQLYGTDVSVALPTYAPNDDFEEGEVIEIDNLDEKKVLEVLQRDLNG
ncbi:hypothetical protein H2200_003106 [Cladophialophora chaetospira]|uniref:Box C/D snoRNA protein 1 n=1 Tax=Cladophialophora chaetospira TaxID=386627 RepID=A0AA38XGQ5_9EURO|nr:hypothetical protein H2200_003106 [Cladophialophora chaetospira]